MAFSRELVQIPATVYEQVLQQRLRALELYRGTLPQGDEVERIRVRMAALGDALAESEAASGTRTRQLLLEGERRGVLGGDPAPSNDAPSGLGAAASQSTSQRLGSSLEVSIFVRMPSVPSGLVQYFAASGAALAEVALANHGLVPRRLRVSCSVPGFSARAVATRELAPGEKARVELFPAFFASAIRQLDELGIAALEVMIDDLESGKIELEETRPIRLMARQTALLFQRNAESGEERDLRPFLGAWVTPNAPAVLGFLREAADFSRLKVMQGYAVDPAGVREHVGALYDALDKAGLTYVSTVGAFGNEHGQFVQRVRLPSESLRARSANCLDAAILMASLLEATGIVTALVLAPGHAYLAWLPVEPTDIPNFSRLLDRPRECWHAWEYLETSWLGRHDFAPACAEGAAASAEFQSREQFCILPIPTLRGQGILPME